MIYIYQHFASNEKIYDTDSSEDDVRMEEDIYPPAHDQIEYGIFEDVIESYYLHVSIENDFQCTHNCYSKENEYDSEHDEDDTM